MFSEGLCFRSGNAYFPSRIRQGGEYQVTQAGGTIVKQEIVFVGPVFRPDFIKKILLKA